jgi:tetratricopeptide (TPR) repeat protein
MTRPAAGSRGQGGSESPPPEVVAGQTPATSQDADAMAADADAMATDADAMATDAGARPTGLRLARLHLRMGSLGLARAELEAFAGRDTLDEAALLDLAEVRWRTGDLAGAGEAAGTLLERGHEDALALVIAAEAIAQEGRPGEARRLAGRALALVDGPLDALFAGIPRSGIWPEDARAGSIAALGTPAGGARAAHAGHAPRAGHAPHVGHAGHLPIPATSDSNAPATTAAAEAFAGGRAALGGGDLHAAALRLGVALRLEPAFAQAVLDAIGERAVDPGLALVAGDALRLLGREAEALAAFDRARGHPAAGAPGLAATTGIAGETGTPPEA